MLLTKTDSLIARTAQLFFYGFGFCTETSYNHGGIAMMWQVKRLATIGVLFVDYAGPGHSIFSTTGPQFSADYNRFSFRLICTFFEFYVSLQRASLTYLRLILSFALSSLKAEIMVRILSLTQNLDHFNDVTN
jgi:hypothetical protein